MGGQDVETDLSIDFRVLEDREASAGAHRPVKQRIHRDTDKSSTVARIGPVRCGGEHVVDELQEVWEVSDSRVLARRVFQVLLVVRDLMSADDAHMRTVQYALVRT